MIRVGFVGAGQIAATHAQSVEQEDGAQVAGFYDVDPARCSELAKRFSAGVYNKMDILLRDVDAVYICTPPKHHREAAVAAAEAGVHVFCEKPLADTTEDALAIAEAVAKANTVFMIGFNFRFMAGFRKLKAIVDSGVLGQVHSFFTVRILHLPHLAPNWRTNQEFVCGMTMESLSHDFDLMRWLVGNPVSVFGVTSTDRPDLVGYDNIMSAVMKLHSGAMASFHSNWVSPLQICQHGVVGANGTAVGHECPTYVVRCKTLSDDQETIDTLDSPEDKVNSHYLETQHFLNCLKTGDPTITSVSDGLATVRISAALLRSVAENRPITLDW